MMPTTLAKINPDANIAAYILAEQIMYRHLTAIDQKLSRLTDANDKPLKQLIIDICEVTNPTKVLRSYSDFKVYQTLINKQTPNYDNVITDYLTDFNGLNIELGPVFQHSILGDGKQLDYFQTKITKHTVQQALAKGWQIYHQIYN